MKNSCKRLLRILSLAYFGLVLTACSTPEKLDYVPQYEVHDQKTAALYDVDGKEVEQFINMLRGIHNENLADMVLNTYADKLYFNDTLNTLNTKEDMLSYLKHTAENLDRYELIILDRAQSGDNIYLRWRMTMEFTAAGKEIESTSVGMTQLKFDDSGKVVFQQDYWDSVEALYQHLPYVGYIIKKVREKL